MASWADEADVLELTGTTVNAAQLAQAQGVIDLYSGTTYAAAVNVSARDTALLKAATAYQAAFMAVQVDVTSRTGATTVQQDGASFTVPDADALILSPLAKRALARLSWRRQSGTVRVGCGTTRYRTWEAYAAAWLRDDSPAADEGWRPL